MINVSKIVNGLTAPEWEKSGKTWDPSLHFTAALYDRKYVSDVNEVLAAFGDKVAAYYLYEPLPGGFSLELQFMSDDVSKKARAMWFAFDRNTDSEDNDGEDGASPAVAVDRVDLVPPVVFDDPNTHQFLLVYNLKRIRFTLATASVKQWFEQGEMALSDKKLTGHAATIAMWRHLKRAMDNDEFKSAEDQANIAAYLSYIGLASRNYEPKYRHITFQIFDDLSHPDIDNWGDRVDHDEVNNQAFFAWPCDAVWPLDDLEQTHEEYLNGDRLDDED